MQLDSDSPARQLLQLLREVTHFDFYPALIEGVAAQFLVRSSMGQNIPGTQADRLTEKWERACQETVDGP